MGDTPNWQQRQQDFFDDLPAPSNAAHLKWSVEKMKELRPELFGFSGLIYSLFVLLRQQFNDKQFIQECIDGGDSRAAVVMSVSPLLVAAYSDELDAVAMLRFPDHLAQKYGLTVGSRLLTVNNYGAESGAMDLMPGPKNTRNWDNIIPTIAEFVSDDLVQIEQLKRAIPEKEWQRAFAMGRQYLQALPGCYRDGRPFLAGMPRTGAAEYVTNLKRAQKNRMLILGGVASAAVLLLMCSGMGALVRGVHQANRRVAANQPFHGPPGLPIVEEPGRNPFAVGDRIEAQWTGRWVPGEVVATVPGGFVRVRLSHGAEPTLPIHVVRKADASSVAQVEAPPPLPVTYRSIPSQPTPPAPPSPPPSPSGSAPASNTTKASSTNPPAESNVTGQFENRTWSDASGRFTVEARLLEFKGGGVHLEKPGGSQLRVPLEKLSEADRAYVHSLPAK